MLLHYNKAHYIFSFAKSIRKNITLMQAQIQATKNHCKFCFDVLLSKLQNKPLPQYPQNQADSDVPIFVTWKKKGQLRGCIGTFTNGKLSKILLQYAITASMKDPRFPPVTKQQLKDLSVGVSLLINFKQTKEIYDWQVGRHGIIAKISHQGFPYSGTYLPQVAMQQKWSQKQTLKSLLRKAGYYGKYQQVQSLIKLTTYQSSKQKMDYTQYCQIINFKKQ